MKVYVVYCGGLDKEVIYWLDRVFQSYEMADKYKEQMKYNDPTGRYYIKEMEVE